MAVASRQPEAKLKKAVASDYSNSLDEEGVAPLRRHDMTARAVRRVAPHSAVASGQPEAQKIS